ncbi:MAG: hypothetical protein M1508_09715 [Nitrospirae bacterium]|nr:hypothetical protein [Nitrospirota bacterium]MCL5422197.1 hypothetical protein [Nitrospirota bacterium]
MVKKSVVWLLVVAFLSFLIVSDYAYAAEGRLGPVGPIDGGGVGTAAVIGGVIALALIIVGIVVLAKGSGSPEQQPEEKKQETPQSLHFQQSDEQLITPSGQIALLRW